MRTLSRVEAIEYLQISEKEFDNYHKKSKEIIGYKERGKWCFNEEVLDSWEGSRRKNTVFLNTEIYEKCFEFAIRIVYGGVALHGIRGQRSEMQACDNFILGILAEQAVKKYLKNKYSVRIQLDEDVHTSYITEQDIVGVMKSGKLKEPLIGVGIKASKMKNGFLILKPNEIESPTRVSDVYIFCRVGLPSDHLFRFLRDHSFIGAASNKIDKDPDSRKIKALEKIPVWICGLTYKEDLVKVGEIPGQVFDGVKGVTDYRYVKSVSEMLSSEKEWGKFIKKLI